MMKSDAPALPALGIDLGGSKIEARLFDAARHELWRERIATPQGNYVDTLAAIVGLVERARQLSPAAAPTVGIGTPGSAGALGRIKNANSTWLNGHTLQADLEATLGQPVALANDANCLALSEAVDGAGAGARTVFAIILGTGVGAGIAVDGRVLVGPNGVAGEWGHNPLPRPADDERPGPRCYCGRLGCIEAWLSGPALAADHARHGGATLDAATIGLRAAAGDRGCRATLARHAQRLARAVAAVINLLDPDAIVFAGGASLLPGLLAALQTELAPHVFGLADDPPLRTRLALAVHGDASGVRGAAWLGQALATR